MANDSQPYIQFSRRNGLVPIPPQLALGEVSDEFRRLLKYYFHQEIESRYDSDAIFRNWKILLKDLCIKHFALEVDRTDYNDLNVFAENVKRFIQDGQFHQIFDLIEFFIRHEKCGVTFRTRCISVFVEAHAAYRVIDNQIVAIGNEEQAEAFLRAVDDAKANGASGARQHLIDAGVALRNGNWAGSVRESIHGVESIAVTIAPDGKDTLSDALNAISKTSHLHPALKNAFMSLYGYTSDEKGIRHALLKEDANVDETDALFMLGACAVFISYLLARLPAKTSEA
jgi:hypothetical protein